MRVTVILLGEGPGPAGVVGVRAANREEGWRQADGDVVAFFDTRYEAGPKWSAALGTADTVGGAVLPGDGYGWAQWVYYVVEYGWKGRLAAGNIAYRRGAVSDIDAFVFGGGTVDDRMNVRLVRAPSFGDYLGDRYRFSRMWGSKYVRPAAAILRVALPMLVLARTPWWRKPLTLPGVLLISLVMAWGEMIGALDGKVKS